MRSACKESQNTADELHLCQYRLEKFLNAGRSEKVMLCECKHHHFVVKAMKKDTTKSEWVTNETRAGQSLHHKGLCKFKECFQDQSYQYIVTEYIKGHDMWEFMEMRGWKPLTEKEARPIMKQIVKTVLYCHKHGVAHKDIKLENVMLDSKLHTKLIDFGFCEFNDHTLSKRFEGTPDYMAPELFLHIPYDPYKGDVFSLGVLLFVLLVGDFPFFWKDTCQRIAQGKQPEVDWKDEKVKALSNSAKELLFKMLNPCPNERMTLQECAHHSWIKKRDSFLGRLVHHHHPMLVHSGHTGGDCVVCQ